MYKPLFFPTGKMLILKYILFYLIHTSHLNLTREGESSFIRGMHDTLVKLKY